MTSKTLYGYISNEPETYLDSKGRVHNYNEPQSEAIDDGLLFNLLISGTLGFKGIEKGISLLNNIKRFNNLKELRDKEKDWGIAYRSYENNPAEAIKKLQETQSGFVPNATNDYGGIDFVWGNNYINKKGKNIGYGLKHTIERRIEQGFNGLDFLMQLPNVLKEGRKYFKKGHNGRFYVGDGVIENVIRTDFDGKKRKWLDTSYYLNKKNNP